MASRELDQTWSRQDLDRKIYGMPALQVGAFHTKPQFATLASYFQVLFTQVVSSLDCYLLFKKFYLFEKQSAIKKEGQRKHGSSQNQEPGSPPGCPTWMAGLKHLGHAVSQVH